MRRATWISAAVLAGVIAGCGGGDGGPPPPTVGDLTVSFFQGSGQPGAILLTISGGAVESVSVPAGLGLQASSGPLTPGITRVVIIGTLHTGDILKVRVPDVAQATSYQVRIDQVADDVTFALIDPAPFTLTIHR